MIVFDAIISIFPFLLGTVCDIARNRGILFWREEGGDSDENCPRSQ